MFVYSSMTSTAPTANQHLAIINKQTNKHGHPQRRVVYRTLCIHVVFLGNCAARSPISTRCDEHINTSLPVCCAGIVNADITLSTRPTLKVTAPSYDARDIVDGISRGYCNAQSNGWYTAFV